MSQVSLSHEFRAPLTSTLMLLEGMLQTLFDEALRRVIFIVISQMNLLLCLVNDLLDLKMIEQGVFTGQVAKFKPLETFDFLIDIFAQ